MKKLYYTSADFPATDVRGQWKVAFRTSESDNLDGYFNGKGIIKMNFWASISYTINSSFEIKIFSTMLIS